MSVLAGPTFGSDNFVLGGGNRSGVRLSVAAGSTVGLVFSGVTGVSFESGFVTLAVFLSEFRTGTSGLATIDSNLLSIRILDLFFDWRICSLFDGGLAHDNVGRICRAGRRCVG